MSEIKHASCLCDAITIKVGSLAKVFTACHCDMCKKWGGIWVAVECNDVSFNAQENIQIYDSSNWAERGFCTVCGSHLFYKAKGEDTYFVPVGLFSENQVFEFNRQIFVDRKPDYYCFSNRTQELTEKDVLEHFSGGNA